MSLLGDVKLLLGIESDASDAILHLMIEDAEQAVRDYCHIPLLPPSLDPFIRSLVIQDFNTQNEGNISAVKRGDTQTSYREPIGADSFTAKQKNRLNAYRKWKAR